MSERLLPTGTVTFMFTDIEGSTHLLTQLGERFREVLEIHHRVLREAIAARGGLEVSTEGDAFFVVFPSASDAVAAAVDVQRSIANAAWPEGVEVGVRIGIHAGEAVLGGDDYTGVDVHRAARIMAAAHGGQIVSSESAHVLAERSAPGISFRDLGEHRLRDLPEPEHLYQVLADGLPERFPALRSLDARPNNLPTPLTTFVGRRRELAEIREILGVSRMVTLTGPGGAGKTRLSLRVARELLPDHEDGVFFVPLASISDPTLVMPSVVEALGLPQSGGRPAVDQLIDHVRERQLLLVLDNLEQVVDAAGDIARLLAAGEGLRVLATSREPLGVQGEREFPVPPLEAPDPEHLPGLERFGQYEAVALFVERATTVSPRFAVTNENAPAVAEICGRLDGLPLAIELAAARVKILSPQEILRRLEDRLGFLTGGGRDRSDRQRTLRGAIAWSYDLLGPDERSVFASLAVFSRGFRLEAAEAVCGGALDGDIFDGVASLVNKSLLRQVESATGDSRFLMLETIREFAAERLEETTDAEDIRRRHAHYFLDLAQRAAPQLFGAEQAQWLSALAAEHDNFRAALSWAEGRGEVELAWRLAASLWRFWQMRGHLREGAERFRSVLSLPVEGADQEARADALEGAGGVVYWMGDWESAETYYAECLEIRRRIGDPKGIADAAYNLSFLYTVPPEPLRDVMRARPLLQEALGSYRTLEDRRGIANVQWAISNNHLVSGEWREAAAAAAEALQLFDELGDRFGAAWAAHSVGLNLIPLGDLAASRLHLRRAMGMFSEAGDLTGIGLVLYDFAALAATEKEFERAIRLRAAAAAIERQAGQGLVTNMENYAWVPDVSDSGLTAEQEAAIRREGEGLSVDQAVAHAMEE
jgi:predicted ATPase/class 3 adenylate cyclase